LTPYQQTLDNLNALQMDVWKLGLSRIQHALNALGSPQNKMPVIHLAGTNGKGSTSVLLAQILQTSGYSVGLFTSPHLQDVRERIRYKGHWMSEDDFCRAFAMVSPFDLTYFEALAAMAFLYFAEQNVDIAIIETGLGGRLDATNVIQQPLCTVLTPISYDHQDRLGHTLTAIATEKCGILRSRTPLVMAPQHPEAERVILSTANRLQIEVKLTSVDRFQSQSLVVNSQQEAHREILDQLTGKTLVSKLLGHYQALNISVAASVCESIASHFTVPYPCFEEALGQVVWPGRYEYDPDNRLLRDGSHNRQGLETLLNSLIIDFSDKKWVLGLSSLSHRDLAFFSNLVSHPHVASVFVLIQESPRFHSLESWQRFYPFIQGISTQDFKALLLEESQLKVMTGSLYSL
jgi:dihydrofolate synthase / folylpolyglutamate synthase